MSSKHEINEAAQARAAAGVSVVVEALQIERVGYVRRGLTDRVAQVDHQLGLLGVDVEYSADAAAETETEAEADAEADAEAGEAAPAPKRGSARGRVPAPSDVEG